MSEQDAADAEDGAEPDADAGDAAGESDGDPESLEEIAAEADPDRADLAEVTAEPDDELVEAVEDREPEDVAAELASLRGQVRELETELAEREAEAEDLESRLKRKQADFQNYKKRQEQKMEDVRARATEDLVERLLDVRDNLARALDQEEGTDIRGGVESTLQQFDEELDRENVVVVEPEPGEETDPTRHEVLMRVDSDQPEGTIDEVHRPGYEMGGKVLRPAQVTVSDG